jgi:hypothetical protein
MRSRTTTLNYAEINTIIIIITTTHFSVHINSYCVQVSKEPQYSNNASRSETRAPAHIHCQQQQQHIDSGNDLS